MAIRWKHGLLRFWIVASVLWIASVWWFEIGADGPYLFRHPMPNAAWQSTETPPGKLLSFRDIGLPEPFDWLDRLNRAVWAFGPPIATLAFAYVIGWIIMGFRPRKVG
jgi:hypothetical protein